jgi:hypothetical protein
LDLFVLGEAFGKRDRRLAEEVGATLLVYHPDRTDQIMTAVAGARPAPAMEPSS